VSDSVSIPEKLFVNTAPKVRRVAYLTSEYARASDTFIRNEVRELRNQACDVHTFSIRRPRERNLSEDVAAEQATTFYLLEHPLQMIAATLTMIVIRPMRFMKACGLLLRLLRERRSAVVRHAFYLMEACLLARCLRKRDVQWLHNHIAENSAAVAMLTSALCGVPYSMAVHGPGIFFHPRQQSLGLKIQHSAFTACITEFCRSQCMIFCHRSDWHRLKIVRCAVGPEFVENEITPIPETKQLVCVGRLCPEKGHLLLLRATKRLVEAGLNPRILLIGDGELRSEIEAYVDSHRLHDNVTIMGWQSSEVVSAQLKASRALVMASFAEGLPVVCMESLALGRPVLATRIAGIPELIEPEVNGWLVTPACEESLVTALRELLSTPVDRLREMGAAGREKVLRLHNAKHEASMLLSLFGTGG